MCTSKLLGGIITMSEVKTQCPQCGQKYNIPAEHLGSEIECPQCLAGFLIQELKETPLVSKSVLTPIEDDEPVNPMSTEKPQEEKDKSIPEHIKIIWHKLKRKPALIVAICCLFILLIVVVRSSINEAQEKSRKAKANKALIDFFNYNPEKDK